MLPEFDKVKVELGHASYEILISAGLLEHLGQIIEPYLQRKSVAIITDRNVAAFHLEKLQHVLDMNSIQHCSFRIEPGESSKDWVNLQETVEWLLKMRIERDDMILAFGGGVVGDLAGFAASVVRRGVSVIQIPTTLLSQVDSSVGGKTGINSVCGKNLIGSFYQPKMVLIDSSMLQTLSGREFLSGYSEIVKYALLGDRVFFDWLQKNKKKLLMRHQATLNEAIKRSCLAKSKLVTLDERENGQRALLNLGHTFGHALEAATNFSDRLIHGEAVSIGCVLAFELSVDMGFCSKEDCDEVKAHFRDLGLKTDIEQIEGPLPRADRLLELMLNDKKVKRGNLNLILVEQIGAAFVSENINIPILMTFLQKKFG